ncbi:MAG: FHA domain-containing protein [Elusimicrobia bacterium]|nr:FHA domain-containing protein [Elusimicrobiota bacterium]
MRPILIGLVVLVLRSPGIAATFNCPPPPADAACRIHATDGRQALGGPDPGLGGPDPGLGELCHCLRLEAVELQKRLSRGWILPEGLERMELRVRGVVGDLEPVSREVPAERRAAWIRGELPQAKLALKDRMNQDNPELEALAKRKLGAAAPEPAPAPAPDAAPVPGQGPPEQRLTPEGVFPPTSGEPRAGADGSKVFQTEKGELTVGADGLRTLKLKGDSDIRLFEVLDADGNRVVRAQIREKDGENPALTLTSTEQYGTDGRRAWVSQHRAGTVDGKEIDDRRHFDALGRPQSSLLRVRENAPGGARLETLVATEGSGPQRIRSTLSKDGKRLEEVFRTGEGPATRVRYDARQRPATIQPGMLNAGPGRRRVDWSELERYEVLPPERLRAVKAEVGKAEGLLSKSGRISPLLDLSEAAPRADFLVAGNRGQAPHHLSFRDGNTIIRPGVDGRGGVSDGRGFAELGIAEPARWRAMIPVAPSTQAQLRAIVIPADQGGVARSQAIYDVRTKGVAGAYVLTVERNRLVDAALPSTNLDWLAKSRLIRPEAAANLGQDIPTGLRDAKDARVTVLFPGDVRDASGRVVVPGVPELLVRGTDEQGRVVGYRASMRGSELLALKTYEEQGFIKKYVADYHGSFDPKTGRGVWTDRQVFESVSRTGPEGARVVRSMNRWERPTSGGWVKDPDAHSFSQNLEGVANSWSESISKGWAGSVSRGMGTLLAPVDKAYDVAQEAALRVGGGAAVRLGLMDKVNYEVVAAATHARRLCGADETCTMGVLAQYSSETQRVAGVIMEERARTRVLHTVTDAELAANLYTGRARVDDRARVEALTSGFSLQNASTALNERGGIGATGVAATLEAGRIAAQSLPFAGAAGLSGGLASRLPAGLASTGRAAGVVSGRLMQANLLVDGAGAAGRAAAVCDGGNQAECRTELMRSGLNFGSMPVLARVQARETLPGGARGADTTALAPRDLAARVSDLPGAQPSAKLRQTDGLWNLADPTKNPSATERAAAAARAMSNMRDHGIAPDQLSPQARAVYDALNGADRTPQYASAGPLPLPPARGPAGLLRGHAPASPKPIEFGGKGAANPESLLFQTRRGEPVAVRALTQGAEDGGYVRVTDRGSHWEVIANDQILKYRAGDEIVVGRAPTGGDAQVRLAGKGVSREHLRLKLGEEGRLEVIDTSLNRSEASRVLVADAHVVGRQQGILGRIVGATVRQGGKPGELIRMGENDPAIVGRSDALNRSGLLNDPTAPDVTRKAAEKVSKLVQTAMPYDPEFRVKNRAGAEATGGMTMALAEVCSGVCRNQAAYAGAILEKNLKRLPDVESVDYVVGGRHAWIELRLKPKPGETAGRSLIVDATHDYVGSPDRVFNREGGTEFRYSDFQRDPFATGDGGAVLAPKTDAAAVLAPPAGWRARVSRALFGEPATSSGDGGGLPPAQTGTAWVPGKYRSEPPGRITAADREFTFFAKGGDGAVYQEAGTNRLVKVFRPERGASQAHIDELVRLRNETLLPIEGVDFIPMKPIRLTDGSWGVEMLKAPGEPLPAVLSRLNPDAKGPIFDPVIPKRGETLPPNIVEYNNLLKRVEHSVVAINKATGGNGEIYKAGSGGLEDMWWNALDERATLPFGNFHVDGPRLINFDPVSMEKLVDRLPGAVAEPRGFMGAPPTGPPARSPSYAELQGRVFPANPALATRDVPAWIDPKSVRNHRNDVYRGMSWDEFVKLRDGGGYRPGELTAKSGLKSVSVGESTYAAETARKHGRPGSPGVLVRFLDARIGKERDVRTLSHMAEQQLLGFKQVEVVSVFDVNGPVSSVRFGSHKPMSKWHSQMRERGWTYAQIEEALGGERWTPATNNVRPENGARRYVHPATGRAVVVDAKTREVLHLAGDGFKD